MFYSLKKAVMCKALAKRNKQQPFDYERAEAFSLQGVEDSMVNNSYYFSAHDSKMSVYARLGRRVNVDETWFCVLLEGKLYSLRQEFFPAGESPLAVKRAGENWTIRFEGTVNDSERAVFSATFVASHPPIDFTSHMPAARMAGAIANEKWDRTYFNALQQVSGQCHYEQEGVLEGNLTLGSQTLPFRLPCVRDHSFGKRDWNFMNNHLWLMAVSPQCQFNYSLVSYPVITALEVGNFRDGSGLHYMLESDLDFRKVDGGVVPGELDLCIRLDNGESLPVRAKVLSGVTYRFQDGAYILHENIADFELGNQRCRGILEIGFNSDSKRFFNQRDYHSIKR